MSFQAVHPATGERGPLHPDTPRAEVARRLAAAAAAQRAWRGRALADRARPLRAAAALLRERKADLARRMADEMGKPLAQGAAEAEKCAWVCELYAEQAEGWLRPQAVATEARESAVHFEPLGVLLAIMPWNFPFWQTVRCAAPALMAGNGVLLKHAPSVPGCALDTAALFADAGVPAGLFATLFVDVADIPDVVAAPEVAAVTLTGSTRAGRSVAAVAGAHLKKCVLELGGSDPYVVLEDADLDVAAAACVSGRLLNGGQSCIAAKRWIVVDAVRADFEQRVLERMRAEVVGDPHDPRTTIGPMARVDLRDELARQVEQSVAAGARRLLGGPVPAGPGAWYPVTLLADVRPGMPAFDEELFGPVGALVPARDEAEALALANASPYGLGAAVFTRDLERGRRIATRDLEAGSCFVNAFVRSDPRLPFGGIKQSGYGRELGLFGLHEFVNVKTVVVS